MDFSPYRIRVERPSALMREPRAFAEFTSSGVRAPGTAWSRNAIPDCRQCLRNRRISISGVEAKALSRRMNRDRVKIAWKFDRKTARRKFGYKKNLFKRS